MSKGRDGGDGKQAAMRVLLNMRGRARPSGGVRQVMISQYEVLSMADDFYTLLRQKPSKFWNPPLTEEINGMKKSRFKELLERDVTDKSDLIILPNGHSEE